MMYFRGDIDKAEEFLEQTNESHGQTTGTTFESKSKFPCQIHREYSILAMGSLHGFQKPRQLKEAKESIN